MTARRQKWEERRYFTATIAHSDSQLFQLSNKANGLSLTFNIPPVSHLQLMNFYKPVGNEDGWLNKIQDIPILQDKEEMRTDREFRRGKVHTTLNKPVTVYAALWVWRNMFIKM